MPIKRRNASFISARARGGAQSALQRRGTGGAVAPARTILECNDSTMVTSRLSGHSLPRPFRYDDYTHVSDLLHKCTRMIALSYQTNTFLTGESVRDNQQIVHIIGHAIQAYVTDKLKLAASNELYGRWTCPCGKSERTGTGMPQHGTCDSCGMPVDRYNELNLKNDQYMISGSVDLTLLIMGAFYLCEVKSIKIDAWKELVRPQPNHLLQVVFYWWLARALTMPLHDQVSVIYVAKDYAFGSPFKEFVINPQDHLHRLDAYLEEAADLLEAKRGGALPVRTCPEVASPMAKKCELCTLCFSMDD